MGITAKIKKCQLIRYHGEASKSFDITMHTSKKPRYDREQYTAVWHRDVSDTFFPHARIYAAAAAPLPP